MARHTGISDALIKPFDGRAVSATQATSLHIDQNLMLGWLRAIAIDKFKHAGACDLEGLIGLVEHGIHQNVLWLLILVERIERNLDIELKRQTHANYLASLRNALQQNGHFLMNHIDRLQRPQHYLEIGNLLIAIPAYQVDTINLDAVNLSGKF
jgi:hypothetical protein